MASRGGVFRPRWWQPPSVQEVSALGTLSSGLVTLDLLATEAADTAAAEITAVSTATLTATETSDTASASVTAAHTASLAATETADAAAIDVSAAHTANFALTESADSAAIELLSEGINLAAVETSDTASLALAAAHTAALAVSETTDTASVALSAAHTASLAATEGTDTASIAVSAFTAVQVAAAESADVASLGVAASHDANLAATESADIPAFSVTAGYSADIVATETADAGAIALSAAHTAALAATEAADTAILLERDPNAFDPRRIPYGGFNKRRKDKPKTPAPMPAAEVVVDEAVLRQIEEERLAALVLEQKKAALERVEELRSYRPIERRPTRSISIEPRRFDVVETSPEIRRRVITLFRPPAEPQPLPPQRSYMTLRALGPRLSPEPDIRKTKSISLRRATGQGMKTGTWNG